MEQKLKEFEQYIRRFPVYKILDYFFVESCDIYKNHKMATRRDLVQVYNKRVGTKIGEYDFNVSQWDLLEVCFYSIKYGNDYRNNEIDKNSFYTLLNKARQISEMLENADEIEKSDILKHLMCITNMEFDFENPNIHAKFNRLYHIMVKINSNPNYDQTKKVCYIDFKNVFYDITGINYDKYIRCYIFIISLILTGKKSDLMLIFDDAKINLTGLGFDKNDIKNIIKLQSREYSFYKDYENWNILKYNPIVHTSERVDKYIITNISALFISFSEFMYWTIRNFFYEKNSRDFTTYFGHCFEFYLDEFLNTYGIEHKKINENNDKSPDWIIETNNYVFIVEQKAALYPMDTRSIIAKNRIQVLNKYLKNNVEKSFIQLNNYTVDSKKTIIRICLMFEQIYMPELVQELILPQIPNLSSPEYLNWIVSINDFEKLFILFNKDIIKFNDIIEMKIELEKTHDNNGRGLDTLLREYENDYILNKIGYFDAIIKEELDILRKNNN